MSVHRPWSAMTVFGVGAIHQKVRKTSNVQHPQAEAEFQRKS